MTAARRSARTRLLGALTTLLFAAFVLNLILGKMHALKMGSFPRLGDASEFLLLFLAAGSFVAYTCSLTVTTASTEDAR